MQGFESQLCTNYLGHFLLTHLLLPVLLTAGESGKPSRVVSFFSNWNECFIELRSLRSISGECFFLCAPLGLLDGCLWSSIEAILCPRTGNATNTDSLLSQTSDLIVYRLTRRMETLKQRRSCLASTLPGKWIQGEEMSRLSGSERRLYQLYSLSFLVFNL